MEADLVPALVRGDRQARIEEAAAVATTPEFGMDGQVFLVGPDVATYGAILDGHRNAAGHPDNRVELRVQFPGRETRETIELQRRLHDSPESCLILGLERSDADAHAPTLYKGGPRLLVGALMSRKKELDAR